MVQNLTLLFMTIEWTEKQRLHVVKEQIFTYYSLKFPKKRVKNSNLELVGRHITNCSPSTYENSACFSFMIQMPKKEKGKCRYTEYRIFL